MHSSWGIIRTIATTNSFVARINKKEHQNNVFFVTATSTPCLSLFKPVTF